MAKRTARRRHVDRHGQNTPERVLLTLACETGRHHTCHGSIVSLLADVGAQCQCACHDGDDIAIEASLERDYFGETPF